MDNNEYELYRTVSIREKEELQRRLVKARCSYLEKWKKLSIFKRRDFGGAKEVCVIYVNSNQREQADAVLEEFLNMRETRRRKRRGTGGRRSPEDRREARRVAQRREERREPPQTETISVERVSPASYDPYSNGEEVSENAAAGRYASVRPSYISGGSEPQDEEMYREEEPENSREGYVLGDEYAELEYDEESEEAPYEDEGAYTDAEFEDDYSEDEDGYAYDEEDEGLFDDDFDDNDIYEDEPQYGERRVMLINEKDSDDGYFLDDGPRLRGSTRVRGGEGSDPNSEFIDDFNFD